MPLFIGIASVNRLQIQDAKGRVAMLHYLRCPRPRCPGLILKLDDLEPCHLGLQPLAQLCEGLRAGKDWGLLTPSVETPDVQLAVIRRPGGNEHFMLGYGSREPDLAWFMVSGGEPSADGFRQALALDAPFRKVLADRLIAELAAGQPARASA